MSGSDEKKPPEYQVGYGKPPKEYQWKPGETGNKKGKPKGARSFENEVRWLLKRKVPVKRNGKVEIMSVARANFERLLHKAMAGDTKAMLIIQELARQYLPEEVRAFEELREEDRMILERFLASHQADSGENSDGDS